MNKSNSHGYAVSLVPIPAQFSNNINNNKTTLHNFICHLHNSICHKLCTMSIE